MRTVLCQRSLAHQTPSRISFRTPPPEGPADQEPCGGWRVARRTPCTPRRRLIRAHPIRALIRRKLPRYSSRVSAGPSLFCLKSPCPKFPFRDSSSAIPRPRFLVRISPSGLRSQFLSHMSSTRVRDARRARATLRLGARPLATEPTQHDHFSPIDRRRGNRRSVVFRWIVCGVDRTESSAPHASFDAPRAHFAAKRAQAARSNVKS